MSDVRETVPVERERAERIWAFLNEFAEYGYRFGLPDDLRDLVNECLTGEDTRRSAWGLDEIRSITGTVGVPVMRGR